MTFPLSNDTRSLSVFPLGQWHPPMAAPRSDANAFARAVDDAREPDVCAVPTTRQREIGDWVDEHVEDHTWAFWKDDAHETAVDVLRGDSELGPLAQDDQRWLVDRLLAQWQGGGGSSATDLAEGVRDDADLGPLVADRLAQRSASLALEHADDDIRSEENSASREYARAAVIATGKRFDRLGHEADPQVLRAMVSGLSTEEATAFTQSLVPWPQALEAVTAAIGGADLDAPSRSFILATVAHARGQTYTEALGPLAMNVGMALARDMYPDDTAMQTQEAERIAGLLTSPDSRSLLSSRQPYPLEDDIPAEQRGQILGILLANPGITAESLGEYGDRQLDLRTYADPWMAPQIAQPLAQDAADMALAHMLSGDGGPGSLQTFDDKAALKSWVAESLHLEPQGDDATTIDKIATAVVTAAGEDWPIEASVLPIQYSNQHTGKVDLPLFKIGQGASAQFVDNQGEHHDSFEAWETGNGLPPGAVTYPRDGELRAGVDGRVPLETRNTPDTPDTFSEHAKDIALTVADTAALVGGLAAAGVMVYTSGGTATPVAAYVAGAASGLWFGGRNAVELAQLGSLDVSDPAVRRAGFYTIAGVVSAVPLGRLAYLGRTGASGDDAAGLWNGLNGTALAADAAAAGNDGFTLAADWEDLSTAQRFELGLGTALWGGMSTAILRRNLSLSGAAGGNGQSLPTVTIPKTRAEQTLENLRDGVYYHVTTRDKADQIVESGLLVGSAEESGRVFAFRAQPTKKETRNSGALGAGQQDTVVLRFKIDTSFRRDPGVHPSLEGLARVSLSEGPFPISEVAEVGFYKPNRLPWRGS